MKHALFAASIALVAVTAVGCGGGDDSKDSSGSGSGGATASDTSGPPTDASKTDFCTAFDTFNADIGKVDTKASTKEQVKQAKAAVAKLAEAGTPQGIDAASRKGYETIVETISKVDDNASKADLQNLDKDLTTADRKNVAAFGKYYATTCAK
jgi:hypothetical protein